MKKRTKALLLSFCAVALVAGSVFGTMAYLTDNDTVTNTFTVGNVDIDLKETEVDTNGTAVSTGAPDAESNKYHLIPGHTYIKDPTVTVKAGSEKAYIKMVVTVTMSEELDAIFAAKNMEDVELTDVVCGYDSNVWTYGGNTEDTTANTRTYTFYYKETVDGKDDHNNDEDEKLPALFSSIKVPGVLTNDQMATLYKSETNHLTITATAYAMQADGFDTAEAAWAAFPTT